MPIRVHIGGKVCLPEEAKISVFDRGFLYGDSVYETIGTAYGRLFAANAHLDRLERSAMRIGLRVPPRGQLERAIAETIEAAGNPESRVRIILTRGQGKLDLDPASVDDTQLVVIVFPLGAPSAEMYEKGVAVHVVSITRNSPSAIDPAV
jgi:branched-chain amino acid aminotransferase